MSSTAESSRSRRPLLRARLLLPGGPHTLVTLIDSGADSCLVSKTVAKQLGLGQVPLSHPIPARALDGHEMGVITHQTAPVSMPLSGNHKETIQFHILNYPDLPLVLGFPWLRRHNPQIDWSTSSIRGWGTTCHLTCLKDAMSPLQPVCTMSPPELSNVPPEYHDFSPVFSKAKATSLPPHRPYDCAIELLPGTIPPKGRLYSLSAP